MANFTTPLVVTKLPGTFWEVAAPFTYHLGAPNGPEFVAIPIGTITDFASIPRPLWAVWPPTGTYGKPAVIHDALYQFPYLSCGMGCLRYTDRSEADAILKEGMEVLSVGRFTRWSIYTGVRLGGWKPWNRYRLVDRRATSLWKL